MSYRCLGALVLSLFTALASASELPETVSQLLHAAHIPEQALGFIVLRGDSILLAQDAGRSMQPASTMKVLTTLVALEQLGPAFRGRTELRTNAAVQDDVTNIDGVLKGDLIVRGGADADLNAVVLEQMLQTLLTQGIKSIDGDVIFDRQLFQPARPDLNLAPFDDMPEARYNVIPDALLINTNLLQIDVSSSAREAKLSMSPALDKVLLDSDMTLTDADCANWKSGWRKPESAQKSDAGDGVLRITLHGAFPRNCTKSASLNLLERHDYDERLLRAIWRRLGGTIKGRVREQGQETDTVTSTRLLLDHVARALPEVLRDINKNSDNTLARLLFLSLGSLESDPFYGSRAQTLLPASTTAARAELAIRLWLQSHNINAEGLVLENGSGLSRLERISPLMMALVLKEGSRSIWAPEFLSSLPIAALDGTMRSRLQGSPAASRARIKTGSLKNVVAIAGYAPDANMQQCVVVAMINHELIGNGVGQAVLDALIDWVAQQP